MLRESIKISSFPAVLRFRPASQRIHPFTRHTLLRRYRREAAEPAFSYGQELHMEQWRLLLAIILSIFVFLAWEFFFPKPQQPPHEAEKPAPAQQGGRTEAPARDAAPAGSRPQREPATAAKPRVPDKPFQSITVRSSLYTARISQKGAALTRYHLHEYRAGVSLQAPRKQLISPDNLYGTALVRTGAGDPGAWFNARYTTDFSGENLEVRDSEQTLSFFWESPEGLVIEKRFTFFPESYRIDLAVIVKNASPQVFSDHLVLTLQDSIPKDRSRFAFEGPFAYLNGSLEEIDVEDIQDQPPLSGEIGWAGLCDRYFMTALVPQGGGEATLSLERDPERNLMAVSYVQPAHELRPNMQDVYPFFLYLGPKRLSILRDYGNDLAQAIDFGFFDIIAKPCLWLLNAIHDHLVPNYGVAIILLTILFKIIFWPLGSKSYRSMAEMKKLQPLMAEIRKKYKDDKKKMNEEIMRLYRTYKVNPMSGCLPMVVQIPVFIAFYRMLYEAIELRHAPFFLWINDLSAPDRLFDFNVEIPLMLPPYGIPVLTIIMGATMFLQQKLSPPPGDPSQAKFMMMMPIIFTVIFINFPSGLVLYWLVNNVISIAQQYYITKKTV